MEPVKRPGQLGTDLQEPVTPRNVGKFVGKYDAPPNLGPIRRGGRKYDEWPENSPRERHGRGMAAFQQPHGTLNFDGLRQLQSCARPSIFEQGLCARGYPCKTRETHD